MSDTNKWDLGRTKSTVATGSQREMGSFIPSHDFRVAQIAIQRCFELEKTPPCRQEDAVEPCLDMGKYVFGLAVDDARRLAYSLAQRNDVENSFYIGFVKAGKNG
jgi:hypothetical protein